MYYDAHIHLLPGIDNGPCLDVAAEMLRILKRERCRLAIATPHFYIDRESCSSFLRRRREKYQELRAALPDECKRFRLLLSAEVFLSEGISQAPQLHKLCIPGTRYLPIELPMGKFEDWMMREISNILHKKHLHLLVCHLERYHFMYSPTDYKRLCGLPNTIYQVSANALLQTEISHDVIRLSLAGKTVILGSNAHNALDRPPISEALVNKITSMGGETAYRLAHDQTIQLFRSLI